jgi:hypothetical protein
MIDVEIIISLATCAVTFVAVFLWVIIRKQMWGELVRVRVNPDDVRSEDIAGYFKEVAISLDERPRKLKLILDGRNNVGKDVALNFTSKGRMEVWVGGDKKSFSLRNRWIPDHSLPLVFSDKRKTLFVKPVDSNRFRVMERYPFNYPRWINPIICIILTVGIFTTRFELVAFASSLMICLYVLKER